MTELCAPRVAMVSLWRNDGERNLEHRAVHLLQRSYPNVRWVWLVGDSSDDTYDRLLAVANAVHPQRRVDIFRFDTGIAGNTIQIRRRRLAATVNYWLARVPREDEYILIHESDIISPADVIEALLAHARDGRVPIAGWPILPVDDAGGAVFYDIWAYRRDGRMFTNSPPFHACYRPDEPFEVDSVGTVWMFHADDARAGARCDDMACVGLCDQLRGRGRHIWVDPQLTVVQPRELWEPWGIDR